MSVIYLGNEIMSFGKEKLGTCTGNINSNAVKLKVYAAK